MDENVSSEERGRGCTACGADVGEAKFCPECGEPIATASAACPDCGHKPEAEVKFCPECGAALPSC